MNLLLPFTLFLFLTPSLSLPDLLRLHNNHHNHNHNHHHQQDQQQEQLEISQPLPTDFLTPTCTLPLLTHSFAHTVGQPPATAAYAPSDSCPYPADLVLQLDAACHGGDQYDRIAAVWLDGAEILRTSTPESDANTTVSWTFRKDVTKYSSLFSSNASLSMMLENVVNDVFTGVFHVNLTLLVYSKPESDPNWLDWDRKPADLILPVAENGDLGFWFRIGRGNGAQSRPVSIPRNARKVVVELYASHHGDDEFWYSNSPDLYIEANNLSTRRGGGAFREVFVKIDGRIVGTEIPFPVIFTGGINPLFWEPVVAIGAFDLPSYEFDVTPFLGRLLDGESHSFEIGVGRAIDFWLVDANVHVWLDQGSEIVVAGAEIHRPPQFGESWEWEMDGLNGEFEVEADRTSRFSGWVASSCGNWTTEVERRVKFKNEIKFERNGTYKVVKQKVELKTEVTVKFPYDGDVISRRTVKRKYPLSVVSETSPGYEAGTYVVMTNVSHAMQEKSSVGKLSWTTNNRQKSGGWMMVRDHDVLSGSTDTQQTYSYRNQTDCYSRQVKAADGELVSDVSAPVCPSLVHNLLDKLLLLGW